MTYLFARGAGDILARFLSKRVLLAFDFDGTLAPIVVDREAARMRRRTARLLDALCRLYPCAVISGRRKEDVQRRIEGLPVRHVLGNHGLEPGGVDASVVAKLTTLRRRLEAELAGAAGIEVEDKGRSLALHYRRARDRPRARERICAALSAVRSPFRVLPGKLVFDVLPGTAPNKGSALARLCAIEDVECAIYVGDDVTDEDVFRMADPERLLPIRIGRSRLSAAPYYLRDQRELDTLLGRAAQRPAA